MACVPKRRAEDLCDLRRLVAAAALLQRYRLASGGDNQHVGKQLCSIKSKLSLCHSSLTAPNRSRMAIHAGLLLLHLLLILCQHQRSCQAVPLRQSTRKPRHHQNCSKMLIEDFKVQSDNVVYSDEYITSTYSYDSTQLTRDSKGSWIVSPTSTEYQFRVDRRVPKLGCVPKAVTLSGLASHAPHCGAAVALLPGADLSALRVLLQGDAGWLGWQQRHNRPGWHLGKQAVSVLCHRGPGLDSMQSESACSMQQQWQRLQAHVRA